MKVKDIVTILENLAPPVYQESYDNSGLLLGSPEQDVSGLLLCLDCTEAVIDEAMRKNCNMVLAHHPLIFKGIKRINGKTDQERTLIKAIQQGIAVYAAHTNLDNVLRRGVNSRFSEKLGLKNLRVLQAKTGLLDKLTVYVPEAYADAVQSAMFSAGAGRIGQYSECSFLVKGTGTFKPGPDAEPFSGTPGIRETGEEIRLEAISPRHLSARVVEAVRTVHPYQEMAYEIVPVSNTHQEVGSGMVGELPVQMKSGEFLEYLKKNLNLSLIRHTAFAGKIHKVAVCGGSGSFLLQDALSAGADAFVTADVKYHDFFDAEGRLLYCDIGHYESEISTLEVFYEVIREKFHNFAVIFCETNTNPIHYFK